MAICDTCNHEKPFSEFSGSNKKCKKCFCKYVKDHYKKNGRSYQRTKKLLKENEKCEICERNDFLEFDHKNRTEKSFTIGGNQSSKSILDEAKKCRILCIWCHRIVTKEYNKIEQDKRLLKLKQDALSILFDENGKECIGFYCDGKKISVNNFYTRKNGKPKGRCKKCISYNDYKCSQTSQNYINDIKKNIGNCEICRIKVETGNELCFDFDHKVPSKKVYDISRLVSIKASKEKIDLEIEKCRLLCCFCHYTHTYSIKKFHKKRETSNI